MHVKIHESFKIKFKIYTENVIVTQQKTTVDKTKKTIDMIDKKSF